MGTDLKGKADALAYLREYGFPTPTIHAEIPLGALVRGFPTQVILRSDHPGEIDGFEGIFDSLVTDYQSKRLVDYCEKMGYDPKQVLPHLTLQIQDYLPYTAIGRIYGHPHDDQRFFMVSQIRTPSSVSDTFYYGNRITGRLKRMPIGDYTKEGFYDHDDDTKETTTKLVDRVHELVDLYMRASSLPKFQDGYVWEMEFGAGLGLMDVDYHILQMRRFRRKEKAPFTLDPAAFDPKQSIQTDLVFGITPPPPEGLRVNHIKLPGLKETKSGRLLAATEGINLLVSCGGGIQIPANAYRNIVARAVRSNGVLMDHHDFRTAKTIPILLFSRDIVDWLFRREESKEDGSLTSYQLYSDGLTAVIQKLEKSDRG